ncbi:MAG: ribosome silencing factor [Acholeplasmataceae bacterium]
MEKINQIINVLEDLKVRDLKVYDFEKSSPFYDYFVIATVNERQGNAAVNHLKQKLTLDEIKHIEGKGGTWVLIDCHDVIVHLFTEEQRQYYGFDQRLMDIKQVK